MSKNLDQLIPKEIMDLLNLTQIKFRIVLQGHPAQHRYPWVDIHLDQQLVYRGYVNSTFDQTFSANATSKQKHCILKIKYSNKTDQDIVIDQSGAVIETQHLEIKNLFVNGIDIVDEQHIPQKFGSYQLSLNPDQIKYYIKNGYSVGPSLSTKMHENGVWQLQFKLPILSFLTQNLNNNCNRPTYFNCQQVLEEIYQRVLICEQLETCNKTKKIV